MNAKPKILVVDDEPGIRGLLQYELGFSGYETVTVESADQALEILQGHPVDLVITDIRMPGSMDGIDFIETYRKENPHQKVIFMTGYAIEEKISLALQNPLSFCIKKPFDIQELSEMIAQCLNESVSNGK